MSAIFLFGVFAVSTSVRNGAGGTRITAIATSGDEAGFDASTPMQSEAPAAAVRILANSGICKTATMTRSTAVVAIELGVMPTKGATGQIAHNDEEKDTFKVEDMPSVALGKVGVDHENAFQQRMLQTLDTTLIECAHSESLRALWVMMRPAFVEHLKYAKYLQSGRN